MGIQKYQTVLIACALGFNFSLTGYVPLLGASEELSLLRAFPGVMFMMALLSVIHVLFTKLSE